MAPRRKPDSERSTRRMVYRPGLPIAGKNGYVAAARVVLFGRIGPGPHKCHWCNRKLAWVVGRRGGTFGAILADHFDGNPLNDAPGNLVPSCHGCNSMRARTAGRVGDDEDYIQRATSRVRAVKRVCEYCGETFLIAAAGAKGGRGRFCCLSHARRTS